MKIKDLFKMLETSNEVSKYCDNKHVVLYITEDVVSENFKYELGSFNSYKEFKAYLKLGYTKEFIDIALHTEFNNNGTLTFSCNETIDYGRYKCKCALTAEFMTIRR